MQGHCLSSIPPPKKGPWCSFTCKQVIGGTIQRSKRVREEGKGYIKCCVIKLATASQET